MQRRAQRIHTLSDGDINKGHSMTVSTQRKSNETLKTKIGLLGAHDVSSTSCSESSTQLGASLSMEADDGDGDELRQGLRRSVPSKRSGRTRTIRRTLSRSLSRLSSLAIILMLSKIDSGLATELDSRSSLRMQQLRGLQNITIGPTMSPILSPSKQPSALPTTSPSDYPTVKPTVMPSQWPSHSPTRLPSPIPSSRPSHIPSLLPSSLPTLRPTSTQLPTHDPSQSPSSRPSYQPSQHPTASPTFIPTFTNQPSVSPTLSTIPTAIPSSSPTSKPSGVPSMLPTRTPSNTPSVSGRPSNIPTNQPTVVPTLSKQPSDNPTSLPTSLPTNIPSWRPSYAPSSKPTVTMMPSASPTGTPSSTPSLSMQPSSQPTQRPTAEPTYTEEIVSKATFIQIFDTNSPIEENTTEATLFEKVMESFTPTITDVKVERISTTCLFLEGTKLNRRKLRSRTRGLQIDNDAVQVTYSMTYSSKHVNVTDYNQLFKSWVNSNLDNVTLALQNAAVDVISTGRAYSLGETDSPTRLSIH